MLKTEQNTPVVEKKVLEAARKAFRTCLIYGKISAHFEHGQWWVQFDDKTEDKIRSFSVQDAEGTVANGVFDGFWFEEV